MNGGYKKTTSNRGQSLGLVDKALPLMVATPPQLRHRRHFQFNGMHFEANPSALQLPRGSQDAGDARWPKVVHSQGEQLSDGNENMLQQNWCDDDNKWLNYGNDCNNDDYPQNNCDKAGGEDVCDNDNSTNNYDNNYNANDQVSEYGGGNTKGQQVLPKCSRRQLDEQDCVQSNSNSNFKLNSNTNCNYNSNSNSNSNYNFRSNTNLNDSQQLQPVSDIYHNYGYSSDYRKQEREWEQEWERRREQRLRVYNRATFRPFGQQHQQLRRMAGGFRAAAVAVAAGTRTGTGNATGIGAEQPPQMDYITLAGFLLGYLTSNVLFFLCWYFSWLKGQVMRMRKHFLGQSNLWEFFDFEDTTRYSMQTKLLLAPIILVCSILYCVVNMLHLLIKLVRADVPRTVVDIVQRIGQSHWT
ncbi:hypothetical protein KR044_001629 [Drosophila immigrans]|nr:hypothetical protein KR044_001629 [Drosophila immigrans]